MEMDRRTQDFPVEQQGIGGFPSRAEQAKMADRPAASISRIRCWIARSQGLRRRRSAGFRTAFWSRWRRVKNHPRREFPARAGCGRRPTVLSMPGTPTRSGLHVGEVRNGMGRS